MTFPTDLQQLWQFHPWVHSQDLPDSSAPLQSYAVPQALAEMPAALAEKIFPHRVEVAGIDITDLDQRQGYVPEHPDLYQQQVSLAQVKRLALAIDRALARSEPDQEALSLRAALGQLQPRLQALREQGLSLEQVRRICVGSLGVQIDIDVLLAVLNDPRLAQH